MPTEPPPSRWVFPPLDGADNDGPVVIGGDLEPATLLAAYRRGLFPMPLPQTDMLGWWSPDPRGVLEPADLYVSRSLARARRRYRITINEAFSDVMVGCADPSRPHGWIDDRFVDAYTELHRLGWADSVEVWSGDELVGGVYGVHIGGFFAGESMFRRARDASKVALAALCDALGRSGVTLFDVQWVTEHLISLGATEIDRISYLGRLTHVVGLPHKSLSQTGCAPMEDR